MATPFDSGHIAGTITRPSAEAFNPRGITTAQISYLTELMIRKGTLLGKSDAELAAVGPWVTNLTKEAASRRIEEVRAWLVKYNNGDPAVRLYSGDRTFEVDHAASRAEMAKISGTPSADAVPEGRYAVATNDGAANSLAFYKVDRPTAGRWAGYVFVKLVLGGGGEQRLSWPTTKAVLAKIAVDARAASIAYGRELGHCGNCGRELTNDESRAYGIGPDCRKKLGW